MDILELKQLEWYIGSKQIHTLKVMDGEALYDKVDYIEFSWVPSLEELKYALILNFGKTERLTVDAVSVSELVEFAKELNTLFVNGGGKADIKDINHLFFNFDKGEYK